MLRSGERIDLGSLIFLGDGLLGYAVCRKGNSGISCLASLGVYTPSRILAVWAKGHTTGKNELQRAKAVTARRGQKDRSRRFAQARRRHVAEQRREARKHTHTAVSERAAVVWNRRVEGREGWGIEYRNITNVETTTQSLKCLSFSKPAYSSYLPDERAGEATYTKGRARHGRSEQKALPEKDGYEEFRQRKSRARQSCSSRHTSRESTTQ